MRGRIRITKSEFRALGGLRNGKLFRVQDARGRWHYYRAEE